MGKIKYQKRIEELFAKSPVVNYSSIKKIVKNDNYTKQLIRNLLLKNKIKKLSKSFYTLYDDSSLVVFCFKPDYLGLQDALSFHDLWEQETIPVVITARKIVPGIRKVMNSNVLIRRINKKYLFGFDYYKQGNLYLPYSDIEKTLIDLVYFNENLNDETVKNIKKRLDFKKLNNYLKNYPKIIQKKVLNSINLKS